MAYWPHPELTYSSMTLVVRTKGEPVSLAGATRGVIRALDPQQPIGNVATMEQLLAKSLARSRFNTVLLAVFALVALVLAMVGTYGVMSYAVTQRTQEFGIRIALGAGAYEVLKLVLGRGMMLAVMGVLLGSAGAFALTRLMTGLLFEVAPTDGVTFGAVAFSLMLVALVACYLPARRATRVDPLIALRAE